MSQSLEERLNYHPDPRCPRGSDRAVDARLALIQAKVDVRGKIVLDLGCSGGLFSFALAKFARKVIAVDGDREVIERNRTIQREMGVQNLEFHYAQIEGDLIRSFGPVDVTLFLSVYHHMLTVSGAYDWNADVTRSVAAEVIRAIHGMTTVLVFEMGYPDEGYEWCARLPDFGKDWDTFVIETIFQGCFDRVEACQPNVPSSWINRAIVSRLGRPYKPDSWILQKVKSFYNSDPRDRRKVYIGSRETCGRSSDREP